MLNHYGYVPLIASGVLLIAGAWATGYCTAPPATRVTVETPVIDHTGLDRLRTQMAALAAQKDAAETALAKAQKQLKVLRTLIEQYREELAAVDEALATREGEAK